MVKQRLRLRRRIGVPKGMLRYLTLKILEKQALSGSELMDQIEGYTDWRPSPGSIYPLLGHLQEEKLIEPHPDEEPGLKRFKLAEEGVRLLEEHGHHDEQIAKRHRTIRKMYWILHREMPEGLYESFSALLDMVEDSYDKLSDEPEASKRFKGILDEASRKLKEIGA